jgi:isopenicillin-N epimerase
VETAAVTLDEAAWVAALAERDIRHFLEANMKLRDLFMLDPEVIFLNHGSFGATPRPVFEAYQAWQQRLERQPVLFIGRELPGHLAEARRILGDYLKADKDDLVYVPNATFALNIVANSLALAEEDEVLTTDHEYGACDNVWDFLSRKRGFRYVKQSLPLPLTTPEAVVEQIWQGVTARTKVIFMSHITSPTAVILPIAAICQRATEAGIITVIDGAHAPGQLPLDLPAIGADFYFGNAHKWLCAAKGAAFLHTRRQRQSLIEPLIVGWGWGEHRTLRHGSDYLDYLQFLGTSDPSAYLSVPAAIQFQAEHNWPAVRQQCHELLCHTLQRTQAITGLPTPYSEAFYHQMAVVPLPPMADLAAFKNQLYDEYCIEIPCMTWQNQQFVRISVQGYNTQEDMDCLVGALGELIR